MPAEPLTDLAAVSKWGRAALAADLATFAPGSTEHELAVLSGKPREIVETGPDAFAVHAARVRDNSHLSAEGKEARLAEAAAEARKRLGEVESRLERHRAHTEELEHELMSAPPELTASQAIYGAELMRAYVAADASGKLALIERALREGDALAAGLILDAPPVLRGDVPPAIFDRLRGVWARKMSPAKAKEAETLRELIGRVEAALLDAHRILTEVIGAPDPVRELAGRKRAEPEPELVIAGGPAVAATES